MFFKTIVVLFVSTSISALDLGEVLVEGETYSSSGPVYLEQDLLINEQTLSDKLSNSVNINQNGDSVHTDLISIRGNNFRSTEYFEDGIPLYRTSGGYVDLSMYNASNSDIYINSGGSQGLYAPSATGGEILLKSKKIKSGFNGYILSSLSTNDFYTNILSSYKDDSWYFILNLNGMKQDEYKLSSDFKHTVIQPNKERVNSDKEQFNGSLKVGYNIDNSSNIAFKFSHLKSEFGNPVRVDDTIPFDKYTRVDNKELSSYWFYFDHVSSDLKVDIRAYYDKYNDIWNYYDSQEFNNLMFNYEPTFKDSRLGTITSIKYKYTPKQEGTLSLQVEKNTHTHDNPDKRDYKSLDSSLSYIHSYKLSEELLLNGSLKYKYQNLFEDKNITYDDNEAVDAQVTMSAKVSKTQSYYISLAHKNRFASLTELYPTFPWESTNKKLKPESSDSIEFGASLKLFPSTVVDISTFYNKIEDKISYQDSSHINIDEANIYGAELSIFNFTFKNQEIELNYAYTDAKDKEDKKILYIPNSKLFVRDSIKFSDDLTFVLSYLYTSKREDIYNNTRYTLSPYSLLDMQISYKADKVLLLKAGVKNILDKNWEYRYGMPAEGRSVFTTLTYTF